MLPASAAASASAGPAADDATAADPAAFADTDTTADTAIVKTLTVLVPCYNEEESLPLLFRRIDALVADRTQIPGHNGARLDYRVMFVDDGSRDGTRSLITQYAARRPWAEYVFLSRNFGKESAMLAGIDRVETDGMVIIDADLQDPPELIPEMAALWLDGYDDVYARRRSRKGDGLFKRLSAKAYYWLLQKVSSVPVQRDTGDFRLLDRRCILALRRMRERDRNTKALFSWVGYRKIEFLYDRDARAAGKTKWSFARLVTLAIDGITSFTTAPLRWATYAGTTMSIAGIIYAIYIIVRTLRNGPDVPGYASLLVFTLFFDGVILITLGILGEYIGRIFEETKGRPDYLIESEHLDDGAALDPDEDMGEAVADDSPAAAANDGPVAADAAAADRPTAAHKHKR